MRVFLCVCFFKLLYLYFYFVRAPYAGSIFLFRSFLQLEIKEMFDTVAIIVDALCMYKVD